MRTATLRNTVTGTEVRVHATTEHPDSHYEHAVWVDDDNNAYCEIGARMASPFYVITEDK